MSTEQPRPTDRFVDRYAAPTEEHDDDRDDPPLPQRDPQKYVAFGTTRVAQGPQMMLRLHATNWHSGAAIEYAHFEGMTFSPDELVLRLVTGRQITLRGRNLEPLMLALTQHRSTWIHTLDRLQAQRIGWDDPDSPLHDRERTIVYEITVT